jgi:hypothetical protein
MHYTQEYYNDALRETEAARTLLIQQAYARKLETRIYELHAELEAVDGTLRSSVTPTQEQVNQLLDALPAAEHVISHIQRIKIIRAAYNLGLAEAKLFVEQWPKTRLPF